MRRVASIAPLACVASFCWVCASVASGADWAQWRGGPHRTGAAGTGPRLIDSLPPGASSPKVLWRAPAIGGWTDPIVADGKVIMTHMGYVQDKVPWRMVPSRQFRTIQGIFGGRKLGAPPFFECWHEVGGAWQRPWDLLTTKKLYGIRDRKFNGQGEFADWCRASGLDAATISKELQMTKQPIGADTVRCLDANTGKQLWEFRVLSKMYMEQYEVYSTAAVADGRVYFASEYLYCLDFQTGRLIWQSDRLREQGNASPLVFEGTVLLNHQAWDAAKGKELWRRLGPVSNSAPVLWRHGGKAYVIAIAPMRKKDPGGTSVSFAACVEPRTGRVLWNQEHWIVQSGWSTPAVEGDLLVNSTGAYTGRVWGWRLTLDKPVQLWYKDSKTLELSCPQSPAIRDGRVYFYSHGKTPGPFCLDAQTGKVIWQGDMVNRTHIHCGPFNSMVMADDKLIYVEAVRGKVTFHHQSSEPGMIHLLGAAGDKYRHLFSWVHHNEIYVTPVVADGRLYLKDAKKNELVCYDLRANSSDD